MTDRNSHRDGDSARSSIEAGLRLPSLLIRLSSTGDRRRKVGNTRNGPRGSELSESTSKAPTSCVAIATSCPSGEWISKPRLRKVANMRPLSLAISATTCFTPHFFASFQAIVGQHPAQPAALPAVDHDHRIFGRLMVDVGHQPADADQLPLAFFLDLGHDGQLAIVVDVAIPRGHFVRRLLEQVVEAEPPRLRRAAGQQIVPQRFVLGLDRPQRDLGARP